MSLTLNDMHNYITKKILELIFHDYNEYKIFSEADFQSVLYFHLNSFVEENDKRNNILILNKPFLKNLRIHPDLLLFKNKKPWVVIEIKEKTKINPNMVKEDDRIIQVKSHNKNCLKRCYFISIALREDKRIEKSMETSNYFYEIPISLENNGWGKDEITT